jgi:hypothetical protein
MEKVIRVILFSFLGFVALLALLIVVLSTLDTKSLISGVVKIIEREMFLRVGYDYRGRSFFELLGGVELENLKIFDATTKNERLLLDAKKVVVQFDIFSLVFTKSPSVYIYCRDIKPNLENISLYLSSQEVKKKFSTPSTEGEQFVPVKAIRLENIMIPLGNKLISASVVLEGFPKLKAWGYVSTTKTKFSFSDGELVIDKILWDDINVDNIRLMFDEKFSEGKGKIEKISYGVFLANSVDFNVDINKGFETFAKFVISIENSNILLTNVSLHLKPENKEVSVSLFRDKLIAKVIIDRLPKVYIKISSLGFSDLPLGVVDIVSDFIRDGVASGNLNIILGEDLKIEGVINSSISTVLNGTLLSAIPINLEFRGKEVNASSILSDGKSDMKVSVDASLELGTNFVVYLNEVRAESKNFYVSSIMFLTQDSGEQKKGRDSSQGNLEFLLLSNTPFYVSISSLYVSGKSPEIQSISIKGILNKGKEVVMKYSVGGLLFREAQIEGSGELEVKEVLRGGLTLLPTKFNLGKVYKNLQIFDYLGGEVYGNAYLDSLTVSIGDKLVVNGKMRFEKVELLGLRLQNEVTKLLNLDLSHIFIDDGLIDMTFENGDIFMKGNMKGDVETEFNLSMRQPKGESGKVFTEVEFSYLKVDRSIVNNLPKVFFIARDINGIRYKLDDSYITFDRFKVKF